MIKFWNIGATAILAAAVVAGGASAGTASHAVKLPFSASFSGTATTQQTDSVVAISASGNGSGALLGAGKIVGKGTGDSSQQPCVPFTGTGSMTGAARTLVSFKVTSGANGCGDEKGEVFAIVGHASVLKATGGKLAGAKGTLKFTGTYDRSSGAFKVKFAGTLTK
jgi:hypothetical protein